MKKDISITVHKGHIIHTPTPHDFDCHRGHYLVHDTYVKGIYGSLEEIANATGCQVDKLDVHDHGDALVIPGFVDIHCHASQFGNYGLGLDKSLLGWLESYTFPEEKKFTDVSYAAEVYGRFVDALIQNGTMRSVLFATIHPESTRYLMTLIKEKGLGAYVGLVNMDRNAPDYLTTGTDQALQETRIWYEEMQLADQGGIVNPILTPRFIPTCSDALMSGLAALTAEWNAPIQSHLSENPDEVAWVRKLCPDSENYTDAYDLRGILTRQTIMAHCVYNSEDEIMRLKTRNVMVAHCPNANSNLASGLMQVRKFLDAGVRVGLGSDVGAGHQLFVPKIMTHAIQMSKLVNAVMDQSLKPLSPAEAFYMGTVGGGRFFGDVGCFLPGMAADLLVIEDDMIGPPKELTLEERMQRFIYCGDDRMIVKRYCNGKEIDM